MSNPIVPVHCGSCEYREILEGKVGELETTTNTAWLNMLEAHQQRNELKAKVAELEEQITEIPTLCRKYEAKITELKNLIADLQCTGVYCGLDGCLCDNCRTKAKAFGDK